MQLNINKSVSKNEESKYKVPPDSPCFSQKHLSSLLAPIRKENKPKTVKTRYLWNKYAFQIILKD